MVGLGGLEPPTSPLSGVRSNQAELQTQLIGKSDYKLNNDLGKQADELIQFTFFSKFLTNFCSADFSD